MKKALLKHVNKNKCLNTIFLFNLCINNSLAGKHSCKGKDRGKTEGKTGCSQTNKNKKTEGDEQNTQQEQEQDKDKKKPGDGDEKNKEKIDKIKENLKNEINPLEKLLDKFKDKVDNFDELNPEISNIKNKINVINSENEGNSINSEITNFKTKFLKSINDKLIKINNDLIKEITKYNDKEYYKIKFKSINIPSFSITELSENNINNEYNKINTFKEDFKKKKDDFIKKVIDEFKKIVNNKNTELGAGKKIKLNEEDLNKIDDIDKFVELKNKTELDIAEKKGNLNELFLDKLNYLKSLKTNPYLKDEKEIENKINDFNSKKNKPSKENIEDINKYIEGLNKIIEQKQSDKTQNDIALYNRLKDVSGHLKLSETEKNTYVKDQLINEKELQEFKNLLSTKLTTFKNDKNKLVNNYIKKINCLSGNDDIKEENYTLKDVDINNIKDDEITDFESKISELLGNLKGKIISINEQIGNYNNICDALNSIKLEQGEISNKVDKISQDNLDTDGDYKTTIDNLNTLKNNVKEKIDIINKICLLLNKEIKIEYKNYKLTISNEELTNENLISKINEKINFKNGKNLDQLIKEKNKEIENYCKFILGNEADVNKKINDQDKYENILNKLKIFNDENIINKKTTDVKDFFYIAQEGKIQFEGQKEYDRIYFEFIKNKKFKIYAYIKTGQFSSNIYFVFGNSFFYIKNSMNDYIKNILTKTGFGFVKIKMKLLKKYNNNDINNKNNSVFFPNNKAGESDQYADNKNISYYLNLEDKCIYIIGLDKKNKENKENKQNIINTQIEYDNIKEYVSFEGRTHELKK